MPSISYSVIKPASIRPLVAAGGGQAFRQQAGERRRRASSLQLASPPVATRNGLACLLAECAILTHKFCHRASISNRRFSYMFAPPSTQLFSFCVFVFPISVFCFQLSVFQRFGPWSVVRGRWSLFSNPPALSWLPVKNPFRESQRTIPIRVY